jgi:hypothetical protein
MMASRHIYKLLIKTPLPRPASHSILYWEIMKRIKAEKGEMKSLFEKRYLPHYRRYKSYRLFLRLRECKSKNKTVNDMGALFAQKKRNPE